MMIKITAKKLIFTNYRDSSKYAFHWIATALFSNKTLTQTQNHIAMICHMLFVSKITAKQCSNLKGSCMATTEMQYYHTH